MQRLFNRRARELVVLEVRDHLLVTHHAKHDVAANGGVLGVAHWVPFAGVLGDASDGRGLQCVQLARGDSKVELSRRFHAIYRRTKLRDVEVGLEDLLLAAVHLGILSTHVAVNAVEFLLVGEG